MERALVIFESMFGNTRTIADAVADGLSSRFETDVIEVSLAPTRIPEEVSLVVVGGPTHAFGLTRPRTREDAANQADGRSSPRAAASESGSMLSKEVHRASTRRPSTPGSRGRGFPVRRPAVPSVVSVASGSGSSLRRRAST